ncbi:hypothetical protein L1987_53104 [Smallanthus sonchifolius]|uniref:Uncharacterized protein n=1 Tax=Smallanthus sonchifolius TaxID=185202 RepID=A0ACB9EUY3_9ASTR|nr:hypothetical protein L1987_53104 [Smallanthus sonchifolius]
MKVLPKSPVQPAQKEKYVNKEQCTGRIISWFYDGESKLFVIKRSDGVQYLKPRIKYFNTLPSSGKYERLKPQKGKRVKITDPKTGKVTWRYKYRPMFNTGETRVEDKDNKVIVCFYDAMNLINFSKKDQRTLRKNKIMFTDEWREQGLQYKRVLEICRRYGVHAGSRLPDNWKSSR